MGYNATIVVMVDALNEIEHDHDFGQKLADAVLKSAMFKQPVDVGAGCHVNAATVIEVHHADFDVTVKVGGNYGQVLKTERN